MMASAGPLSSMLLAVIFYAIFHLTKIAGWSEAIYGVIKYLAWINGILAVFNLIPAFPPGRRPYPALPVVGVEG